MYVWLRHIGWDGSFIEVDESEKNAFRVPKNVWDDYERTVSEAYRARMLIGSFLEAARAKGL